MLEDHISCENILIRGVNWVGDAVMTMPTIRGIRDNFPDANISLLVKPWVLELFRNDPNINELLPYGEEYRGLVGKIRAGKDMRNKNFQCSYLLQNALDAALLAFLARIPQRIGFSRDGRGVLLTHRVKADRVALDLHHIKYYLYLLERTGHSTTYRLPWIYPSLDERLRARSVLGTLKRPVVGLNPGAAYGSAKRWPVHRFRDVANSIIKDIGGSIVLFGSSSELPMSEAILDAMDSDLISSTTCLSLAGKSTLSGLCDLIAECDLLITNDSGPMHIGYAVGTPLIGIFGSTSPRHTGPPVYSFDGSELGFKSKILTGTADCAPCFQRTCRYGHLQCMESISAETVLDAVRDLLPDRKAIFFDRDGTLCRDAHYLSRMEDLDIFPDVEELRRLKDKGYLLIGITNQSGIARGIVDEQFVRTVHTIFTNKYGFDDFYYCPHHPDDRCACRKPFHGMLLKARADHEIDLRRSYVVGDSERDIIAGILAGAGTVLAGSAETPETLTGHRIENVGGILSIV